MFNRRFDDDEDDERPRSMSVSSQTLQIMSVLKSRQKIPSMESVMQWLFVNLSEESFKEVKDICNFLNFPPPFKNTFEVQREYNRNNSFGLSEDEINDYGDRFSKEILEETNIEFMKDAWDITLLEYLNEKIPSLRKEGLSTPRIMECIDEILEQVKGRIKSIP